MKASPPPSRQRKLSFREVREQRQLHRFSQTVHKAEHTLTLPWVEAATSGFVKAAEMREAFSLAIVSGRNLIFSGPGGHGKSEFLAAAIAAIQDVDPFVKSFGQGTSAEELYGGIDLDAMNRAEEASIQYKPEFSFLRHRIAVFEELFDAPSRVLTSLKDTLTAGALRNGHQYEKMLTRVIFAATNHSPQDIAEAGPEIAALVERFPIQLKVEWDHYDEEAYVDLFDAVLSSHDTEPASLVSWDEVAALQQRTENVVVGKTMRRLIARVIVELRNDKVIISPRTARFAIQLAQAAAVINDRNSVEAQDFRVLAFLPGVQNLKHRVDELIKEHSISLVSEERLEDLESDLRETEELLSLAESIEDVDAIIDILDSKASEVQRLRLHPHQTPRRSRILTRIDILRGEARKHIARLGVDEARERLEEIKSLVRTYHQRRDPLRIQELESEVGGMNLHSSLEPLRDDVLVAIRFTRLGR